VSSIPDDEEREMQGVWYYKYELTKQKIEIVERYQNFRHQEERNYEKKIN
jgi:hypothetical protein